MDNQQPSTLEERMYFLAMNAKFGDGTLWKHPECKDFKMVFTSTTPELLEVKRRILPEMFGTETKLLRKANHPGCYKNAKALYYLQSFIHPIFTSVRKTDKLILIPKLKLFDLALWFLDDGSSIKRSDSKKEAYRFRICIGNTCNTLEKELAFKEMLSGMFKTNKIGVIGPNSSKATENNKVWTIPQPIAFQIMKEAEKYNVLKHKFPYGKGSETIPCGVGGQGQAPRSIASSLRKLVR